MPDCRVGAHTFIFQQYGYDQGKQLGKILETVADAGYQAVELNRTALDSDSYKSQIEMSLRKTGLELVGASHGLPLWNIAEYERTLELIDEYSDRLALFGAGLKCGMTCSGRHYDQRSVQENDHLIEAWSELAEIFRSKDLELNYHTHGEPLEDIQFVLENVPEDLLPLGPDLDWLRVGGVDPQGFLREHADRLSVIHLRDYREGGDRTAALGEGDVDYAELGALLDEIGFSGDLVVELALPSGARPDRPVLELLKASREHLRKTMGI